MKKKSLKNLDLDVYSEVLDNGLEVYLVPFNKVKRYFITYATRFGSLITEFTPNGEKKQVKVPNGIAHFLEHKMFEQESGDDPFEFFSKSGTYVNASTGFESTRYICSGTNNFVENLKYLLSFVNNPYFTSENVEKEKGIIIEELNMYKDNPSSALDDKCRKNIFNKDPHRIDIGGEVEDVKKITKEDLYLCYNNFYCPRNMFVLIVGNFDVDEAINILKEELGVLQNKYNSMPKIKKINEPYQVYKEKEVINFNIEIPKIAYSLKLKRKDFKIKEDFVLDCYLNIILKSLFSSTSKFSEEGKQKKLFTTFEYDFDVTDDYVVITLYIESQKQNELLKFIKRTLEHKDEYLNEEEFDRARKVYIARTIKNSCYIDSISNNIYEDLINYKKVIYNKIDIVKNLDYQNLLQVSDSMDINNNSIVCFVPNNDNKFNIEI